MPKNGIARTKQTTRPPREVFCWPGQGGRVVVFIVALSFCPTCNFQLEPANHTPARSQPYPTTNPTASPVTQPHHTLNHAASHTPRQRSQLQPNLLVRGFRLTKGPPHTHIACKMCQNYFFRMFVPCKFSSNGLVVFVNTCRSKCVRTVASRCTALS